MKIPIQIEIEVGTRRVKYEAVMDVDDDEDEARIKDVVKSAVEMGFALLGVGAELEEHRV